MSFLWLSQKTTPHLEPSPCLQQYFPISLQSRFIRDNESRQEKSEWDLLGFGTPVHPSELFLYPPWHSFNHGIPGNHYISRSKSRCFNKGLMAQPKAIPAAFPKVIRPFPAPQLPRNINFLIPVGQIFLLKMSGWSGNTSGDGSLYI